MKDSIHKEHIFKHAIDKIWNAISNAEALSSWFIPADFKAETGYKYTFNSQDKENCTQITGIVQYAQPYTLIYTWIVAGTAIETKVTWKLEQIENGTKLYLEHSGISNYEGETAIAMFNSFDGGWNNCINKLTTYLREEIHAG